MRSYPGKKYLIVFNTWQKIFHYHFSTARLTIKNKLGILILHLKIFRQPIKANNVDNIERFTLEGTAFHNDLHMTQNALWGKVFKSGLNKFSARQPLKNLLSPFLNTLYHIHQPSLFIAKVKTIISEKWKAIIAKDGGTGCFKTVPTTHQRIKVSAVGNFEMSCSRRAFFKQRSNRLLIRIHLWTHFKFININFTIVYAH